MASSGPDSHPTALSADIVIIGGGIAGLWMLNRLTAEGYQVLLLEASALGQGQSIASQGIIHGGLKYALDGSLGGAAHAIAGMPARWQACLAGTGDVDLQGCQLLSSHYYMWSDGGVRSRLKAFLGSKSLRGRVQTLTTAEQPDFFRSNHLSGTVYELPDFVVDTPSLLRVLAGRHSRCLIRMDAESLKFSRNASGDVTAVVFTCGAQAVSITARRFIFSAGAGNGDLIKRAGIGDTNMQLRPLRMVMVKSHTLPKAFVHCIGDSFSLTPLLTVTSHAGDDGSTVWYLGGDLAEKGVARSDAEQISAARQLLSGLFPHTELDGAQWHTLLINRAEGRIEGQHRPDSVYVSVQANVLVTWPTKFTLSPALADEVVTQLRRQVFVPGSGHITDTSGLPKPAIATPPWNERFH